MPLKRVWLIIRRPWCSFGRCYYEVYPQLNKSLLYAGIMLHDLAKVIELTGPDQTEYTVRGNLLGHIALIDSEITKTVMELGIDDTKEEVVLFATSSSVTMAYLSMEVQFVHALWKQRLSI